MSVAAYKQTIREVETPREIERRIFARLCRDLNQHCAAFDAAETRMERLGILHAGLAAALGDNERFWLALKHDLAAPENQFPVELKASLISIALWVERQTAAILGGEGKVAPLLDINRNIGAGLTSRAPALVTEDH